jgi:hypothetical protein
MRAWPNAASGRTVTQSSSTWVTHVISRKPTAIKQLIGLLRIKGADYIDFITEQVGDSGLRFIRYDMNKK